MYQFDNCKSPLVDWSLQKSCHEKAHLVWLSRLKSAISHGSWILFFVVFLSWLCESLRKLCTGTQGLSHAMGQSMTWELFEFPSSPPVIASTPFSQCAITLLGTGCSHHFPIDPGLLQCLSPVVPIPLLTLLTVSPEWIPQHIISCMFGSVSLSAWTSGLLDSPWSPLWENTGEKNKVVLGSQMKGYEASGEKRVYLLSLVTIPQPSSQVHCLLPLEDSSPP